MKGVIFNLLEEVFIDAHGEDAWDDLLEAASVDGTYTSLGSYADADLGALVRSAGAVTGDDEQDVLRWFGRSAIPKLASLYPHFFEERDLRSFLLSLNDIIHAEVLKLYPGAVTPTFDYATGPGGVLVIGYRSPRMLCALAEGFIDGASAQFSEPVDVTQSSCMIRGDDRCAIECTFREAPT